MNIKQFVGLNYQNKDEKGNEMPHVEIYTQVVEAIGLARCFKHVPATEIEIIQALQTDEHLNNIPLKLWDDQHRHVIRLLRSIGITTISLANTVCVLKQAARMQVSLANANPECEIVEEDARVQV